MPGFPALKTTSVTNGPIMTSTPIRIIRMSLPPSAVKRGEGYQTFKVTKSETAAIAALIRRWMPDACHREIARAGAKVVSAIFLAHWDGVSHWKRYEIEKFSLRLAASSPGGAQLH